MRAPLRRSLSREPPEAPPPGRCRTQPGPRAPDAYNPSAHAPAGRFRLGPYEILSLIGAGGMGEVYQARDTRLDRKVAVKVLAPELADDPEFSARFEREAKAISSLNHPHICGLYDIGRADQLAGMDAGRHRRHL